MSGNAVVPSTCIQSQSQPAKPLAASKLRLTDVTDLRLFRVSSEQPVIDVNARAVNGDEDIVTHLEHFATRGPAVCLPTKAHSSALHIAFEHTQLGGGLITFASQRIKLGVSMLHQRNAPHLHGQYCRQYDRQHAY